jgi:hypothetical protein
MNRTLIALATAGALVIAPAAANAATGGTASLDKAFKWSGGPGQGLYLPSLMDISGAADSGDYQCTDYQECDDTLVKVEEAGNDLTVTLTGAAGDTPELPELGGVDLDMFVYKSDKNGTVGENLGGSTSATANETVLLPGVEAGYYLVRVVFYQAVNATFDAKAELTVPVPPEEEEE